MDATEAARALHNCEYGQEGSPSLFKEMKEAGLVAVFGTSDDLMEFRGAVNNEVSAYGGTIEFFTKSGLLQNECENEECPYFAQMQKNSTPLKAIWNEDGFDWRYETVIPHQKFTVLEDGASYCEGIVFALSDVPT